MSLVGFFKGKGNSGFGYGSTAEEVTRNLDLHGTTILITGCASGLGAETMRVLTMRGARILGAARSIETAAAACAQAPGEAIPIACDLSEPASVRAAVARVKELGFPLDAIVANAGIMAPPRLQQKCGLELQFLTNHVGHHMLITRLVDQLSATGRVVIVSSAAHKQAPAEGIELDNLSGERHYSAWRAYGQSKLANILFAKELATRLPNPGQTANALHPGVIATNLNRHLGTFMKAMYPVMSPFMKSVPQGAATQCYLAVNPAAASITGAYFADCNVTTPSPKAQDAALAKRLWARTEEIIASA